MPWKIVNLDFACDRPHLHLKDPAQPIHLRSYLAEARVEIALGADDPDDCSVRASVTPDHVKVDATRFERLHVNILGSILASLDVEPQERDAAMGWMHAAMTRGGPSFQGNVASFPPPTGWPYDLTDDALMDSIRDGEALPSTRRRALAREAARRGLGPPEEPRSGAPRGPHGPGPEVEVMRRRPR